MTSTALQPILAASACVWKEGRVLMIKRAKPPVGLWSLPGGHVQFGETAQQAAVREMQEETGVTAHLTALVGLYDIIHPAHHVHYAIACYGGLWLQGEAAAASDALAVAWVLPEQVAALKTAPNIIAAVTQSRKLIKATLCI